MSNMFPKLNPHCGLSWNGFALEGSNKSIKELKRLIYCESRLQDLEGMIKRKELVYDSKKA